MVEDVEELAPELKISSLAKIKLSSERYIQLIN
jgi:hypothetical protein